ncbi:MAG: purine-nucleoside phosphorylase [Desulfobacteraceae bacterium]|nr:purine-nucleoside phosphorylase [Desulfobacteraceae bacterium]
MEILDQIHQAAGRIKDQIDIMPQIGLILGSGLGALAGEVKDPVTISYGDIPHFQESTVEGHSGQLVIGLLEEKPVLVLQGRIHYYEGFTMNQVVFPVRCMKALGINSLVVTNAAGSLDTEYHPGDLMLIRDHIKMVSDSPLRGPNIDEFGPRFNDLSDPYTKDIRTMAKKCGRELGIVLKEGVYCYMPGPSYETASEVRMLKLLGGHAVGMSTVPEVITAGHAGMNVMGLSCLTNMGTGILDQPLDHSEVVETGVRVRETFISLLKRIVREWPIG